MSAYPELLSWSMAIAVFAFAMTFTPGPNNIMLATSGANFGIKRSMPHVMGVALGFPVMLVIVASGLSVVFQIPEFRMAFKVIGFAYILYLAYAVASASVAEGRAGRGKPLGFLEAAAFQWVNPKAWAQAIGASSAYLTLDEAKFMQVLMIAAIFIPIGIASSYVWAAFGDKLSRVLNTPKRLRVFNYTMAVALVVTVVPSVFLF